MLLAWTHEGRTDGLGHEAAGGSLGAQRAPKEDG